MSFIEILRFNVPSLESLCVNEIQKNLNLSIDLRNVPIPLIKKILRKSNINQLNNIINYNISIKNNLFLNKNLRNELWKEKYVQNMYTISEFEKNDKTIDWKKRLYNNIEEQKKKISITKKKLKSEHRKHEYEKKKKSTVKIVPILRKKRRGRTKTDILRSNFRKKRNNYISPYDRKQKINPKKIRDLNSIPKRIYPKKKVISKSTGWDFDKVKTVKKRMIKIPSSSSSEEEEEDYFYGKRRFDLRGTKNKEKKKKKKKNSSIVPMSHIFKDISKDNKNLHLRKTVLYDDKIRKRKRINEYNNKIQRKKRKISNNEFVKIPRKKKGTK